MYQGALITCTHSPNGDPTPVPQNGTFVSEGITRTGKESCSKLPRSIIWRKNTKVAQITVPVNMYPGGVT